MSIQTLQGKRIIICSPGIPHPTRGASTVLFYHYIEAFKQTGATILNLLLLQPDNSSPEQLREYQERIAEPGQFDLLPCQADRYIMADRFRVWLNEPAITGTLVQAQQFQPEVVFSLDLMSAWVTMNIPSRFKAVWLGDLNFQTEWYNVWYGAREDWRQIRGLPFAWNRRRVWRSIYQDVLKRFDLVVVSSKSSEEHLAKLGIKSQYLPYPWPNTNASSPPAPSPQSKEGGNTKKKPTFVFFGSLTGLGSRSAFHFMLSKVYPRLRQLWGAGGFEINIAGMRGLPKWVEAELANKPEFSYLGFVDDLDGLLASCHAVLAPIDVPVGNRSRILTAMAKGALVIAHRNAALGNPDLVDGDTCYLADNAVQFVGRMRSVVEHPDQSAAIVERARACYENQFRPDVATRLLIEAVQRLYS